MLTTKAGFDASKVTEPLKLLPITKLEKAISKAAFEKHVNQFVVKPPASLP